MELNSEYQLVGISPPMTPRGGTSYGQTYILLYAKQENVKNSQGQSTSQYEITTRLYICATKDDAKYWNYATSFSTTLNGKSLYSYSKVKMPNKDWDAIDQYITVGATKYHFKRRFLLKEYTSIINTTAVSLQSTFTFAAKDTQATTAAVKLMRLRIPLKYCFKDTDGNWYTKIHPTLLYGVNESRGYGFINKQTDSAYYNYYKSISTASSAIKTVSSAAKAEPILYVPKTGTTVKTKTVEVSIDPGNPTAPYVPDQPGVPVVREGYVYIYTKGTEGEEDSWKAYEPYIFSNNKWNYAEPYVYVEKWKLGQIVQ